MKLKIGQAIVKGMRALKTNPIIFIPAGVIAFLFGVFNYFTVNVYQGGEAPTNLSGFTGYLSGYQYLAGYSLLALTGTFVSCVIIKMIYDSVYGKPSLSKAIEVAVRKFMPVLMVGIIWWLIFTAGAVFLILPGVFVGIKLIFAGYFVLIEDEGIFSSLSKSWSMTEGNWWRVFWLSLIIMGVLLGVAVFLISPLPRLAESFADFLFVAIYLPLYYSLYVAVYLQLRLA